ncbi:MAG: c-type cytochrome [Solirubrobacterales bacterium]
MNETLFYICGITLAVSAVVVSFLGLKVKDFPGRLFPIVIVWFVVFVGGATTFSVLHAKDLDEEKAHEFEHKNEEIEKEQTSEPFEEAEEEGSEVQEEEEEGSEAEAGGDAEAGAAVFTSAGCGSCHTFAAAGSTGSVGPDLDEALVAGTDEAKLEEDVVDPNKEIAESFPEGIMPGNFGETLSSEELADLVAFLYQNSPAGE